jgi:hypothetical protein
MNIIYNVEEKIQKQTQCLTRSQKTTKTPINLSKEKNRL